MLTLLRTDSQNEDFKSLVKLLDASLAVTDGDDHAFYDQFNKIDNIKYAVVAYKDNRAVGCGAIKQFDNRTVEVKRMYVSETERGYGIASVVLKELEDWATELGFFRTILETGSRQVEALALYPKNNYVVIENYGQYIGVENSVCFEKHLLNIRLATDDDTDAIWEIFSEVIQSGEYYVFAPTTSKSAFQELWLSPKMHVFVAEQNGEILGSYYLKPNQLDAGNHIANAGYMVSEKARGKGIGDLMCKHSLNKASEFSFLGMQFNMVVSTNVSAVKLWQKNGFEIIGTIPGGFKHPRIGYVDAYIMFRSV